MSALEPENVMTLTSSPGKKKILVYEMEGLTRKLISKTLSDAAYEVDFLEEDGDIVSMLKGKKYSAAIIGTLPPGQHCTVLCKAIRVVFSEWELPVIVLSENKYLNEIDNCMASGASDFIVKPIKWPLLLSRLNMGIKLTEFSNNLYEKERRLRKSQTMARIGYWHMKDDPSNVSFSEQFCNILDIPPGSIKTFQDLFEIVHPDDQENFISETQKAFLMKQSFTFSHRILMPNGQEFFVSQIGEFSDIVESEGSSKEFFVTMRDETEIYFAKAKLYEEKFFDTVTGLPNRAHFMESLEEVIEIAGKEEKMLSCFCVGIEGYKGVSNALGPAGMDELLRSLGQRLGGLKEEFVVISHYGANVFTLLSEKMRTIVEAEEVADNILTLIGKTISVAEHDMHLKANIGVSFFPFDGEDADSIVAAASTALHDVKNKGGDSVAIHTHAMHKKVKKKLYIESELKIAIDNGDFELFYQPQVSISNHNVSGMEALIRWNHPSRGLIPPFEFIDIAEEKGLIVPMGEWILDQACKDAVEFQSLGFPDLRIGINLSAKQFNDKDFLRKIEKAISNSNIDPVTLELEVTESSAMSDLDNAIKILGSLRAIGAHTSMDDFGTGFSSLGSLQTLPLNTLKIDRAFIKDIGLRDNAGAIATAIIAMAKGLGMDTIAEGVETDFQLDFMRSQSCDVIQGFYYSKPLPKDDFSEFIRKFGK